MSARPTPGPTPTPWEIVPDSANGKDEAWCHWHKVGPLELRGKDPTPDSLFVQRCVNSHAALVQALRDADRMVDRVMTRLGGNGRANPTDVSWARTILREGQEAARAALKLAGDA